MIFEGEHGMRPKMIFFSLYFCIKNIIALKLLTQTQKAFKGHNFIKTHPPAGSHMHTLRQSSLGAAPSNRVLES